VTAHNGKDMEQGKYSSISGRDANLYSHFGNQYGVFFFFLKLVIDLPQDPALALLGIYPKFAQQCS
jgi:hypothetical protein